MRWRQPSSTEVPMRVIGLVLALGLTLAPPLVAEAQPAGKVWRIGVLSALYPPDADPPRAFRQGLRELDYVEGRNIAIDWRYSQGRDDRLPSLAAELVQRKVDLIVADTTLSSRAAMRETSTIPIVMAFSADPIGGGIVSSLARPGGNVTGNSVMLAETSVKRLELLKEAVPTVSRVGVLWDPSIPFHKAMLKEIAAAAPSLRLEPLTIAVKSRADLGNALPEITKRRAGALFVSQTMSPAARQQLLEFAAKNRLPTMFSDTAYVPAGGLMSYSPNRVEMFRTAATYVDKILKGAKPADLPIEQPTKFELVINLKTAKALGLTIPQTLLLRADRVIQ